jgi:hypothetical protein
MIVSVRADAADQVEQLLDGYGRRANATELPVEVVQFRIPTRTAEQSPFARALVADLAALGDDVLVVHVP